MLDFILASLIGLRNEGASGLIIATGLFAVGAMMFAPRPLLCAASGWVFGFSSVIPIIIGWTVGSVAAAALARHLLRNSIQSRLDGSRRLRILNKVVETEGFKIVLLMRVSSPVPSTLLSYLVGLTKLPLLQFGMATLIGIVPQVILFVYLGSFGFDLADKGRFGQFEAFLLVTGVLVMVAVTLIVRQKVKHILDSSAV